jgi:WD40 repeat protein
VVGVGIEGRYQFFRTDSWRPGPEIEQGGGYVPLADDPGSRLAAYLDSKAFKVRLVEVETGHVLASLEAPESTQTSSLAFSPDGRFLAAAKSDQRVDVWDLSTIRRRLDALQLATELPNFFGGETSGAASTIERIEVEGAEFPTDPFTRRGGTSRLPCLTTGTESLGNGTLHSSRWNAGWASRQ